MDTEEILKSINPNGNKESPLRGYLIFLGTLLMIGLCACAFCLSAKYAHLDRKVRNRNNVICTQATYNEHEYLFFNQPMRGIVHSPDCGKCAKKDSFNRGDVQNKQPKMQAQKGETKRYIIMPTVEEKVPVKE